MKHLPLPLDLTEGQMKHSHCKVCQEIYSLKGWKEKSEAAAESLCYSLQSSKKPEFENDDDFCLFIFS